MAARSPAPRNMANIDTKNAAPGTYTVKGHVTEGNKPGQMADCSAPFTVKPFEPPTDQLLGESFDGCILETPRRSPRTASARRIVL